MKRSIFDNLSDILFQDNKGAKFLNSHWQTVLTKDPLFTEIFMTIDLVFGNGKLLRLSSNELEVTDGENKVGYLPLLMDEPAISTSYTIGSGDASQRTIGISLDGRLVDAPSIIASGRTVAGVGQISLQYDGGEYKNRLVLLDGIMTGGVEFGFKDEPITLDISDPVVAKDRIVPELYITKEDFPHMPEDQIGQKFPMVVNGFQGGVPLIRIIPSSHYDYGCTYVVCFGHSVIIESIKIDGNTVDPNDVERGWTVLRQTTQSGIPYTAVDFVFPASVSADPNMTDSEALYGLWPDSVSVYAQVSINSQQQKSAIESIKDLILENSNYSHNDFDWNLYAKSISRCPFIAIQILLNGSDTDNTATVIDYIQSTLLPSIPMLNIVFNRVGIGILFTDRRIDNYSLNLVKGQNILIDRVSSIKETQITDVFNSFNLKYSYDAEKDNYQKNITIDASNNKFCKMSEELFGKIEHDVIESIVLFDDETANYVLNWLAAHKSLPRYEVQYNVIASAVTFIDIGDNVQITDDELGWSNVRATVTGIEYNRGNMILTFTAWILFDGVDKNTSR